MKTLYLFIAILAMLVFSHTSYSQKSVPQGTLTVCENTDDDVNPINPKTVIKVGEPVVYQIAFTNPYTIKDEKESDQFFIAWEVYKMDDDGKDIENFTELQMTAGSLYRRYAITEFQTFYKPGKYRVYALPWEMRDINYKNGNYKKYFGKTEIEVVE